MNIYNNLKMLCKLYEVKRFEFDPLKDKLFNTYYLCPICYEPQAIKGLFKCRHRICKGCYVRLSQKCCPMRRSK